MPMRLFSRLRSSKNEKQKKNLVISAPDISRAEYLGYGGLLQTPYAYERSPRPQSSISTIDRQCTEYRRSFAQLREHDRISNIYDSSDTKRLLNTKNTFQQADLNAVPHSSRRDRQSLYSSNISAGEFGALIDRGKRYSANANDFEQHNKRQFRSTSASEVPDTAPLISGQENSKPRMTRALRALKVRSRDILYPKPKLRFEYEPVENFDMSRMSNTGSEGKRSQVMRSLPADNIPDNLSSRGIRLALERDARRSASHGEVQDVKSQDIYRENNSQDDEFTEGDLQNSWPWRDSIELHSEPNRANNEQVLDNHVTDDSEPTTTGEDIVDLYLESHSSVPSRHSTDESVTFSVQPSESVNNQFSRWSTENREYESIQMPGPKYDYKPGSGRVLTTAWASFLKRATAERIQKEQEARFKEEDAHNRSPSVSSETRSSESQVSVSISRDRFSQELDLGEFERRIQDGLKNTISRAIITNSPIRSRQPPS
ncbi:hypothetical protein V1511DRAFT_292550 [Dipodascopsis uninucleata]